MTAARDLCPSNWRRLLDAFPPDFRDAYEERAALIEFDGGEKRKTAERRAFECVSGAEVRDSRDFRASQNSPPML